MTVHVRDSVAWTGDGERGEGWVDARHLGGSSVRT